MRAGGKKEMWPRCRGDRSGDRQRKPLGLITSTEGTGLSVLRMNPSDYKLCNTLEHKGNGQS